jgi:flagellar biosynthesis/type III secretory pathway protein FliH
MSNNKAREIHSPLIQLIDETSPEELAKIDGEMRSYADGYADGYAEGYKRALEVMEWYIKNHISGMVQDHIGEDNKMVGGKQ